MGYAGLLKKTLMLSILLLLVIAIVTPQDAFARTEARYEGRIGDTVFGNDIYSSTNKQTLFHQQTLNNTDLEHYDLSFPVFADGASLGPSSIGTGAGIGVNTGTGIGTDGTGIGIGGGTGLGIGLGAQGSANIVPFGPVNLAFPSINEDVTQKYSATSTGFFTSNYNYRPEAVLGNVPLTTDYPTNLRQAITPASALVSSPLYPEQYNTIAITNKLKAAGTSQTATNASNQTGTQVNSPVKNDTSSIKAPDFKISNSLNLFTPKNASSKPEDNPVVYPSDFNMAGRDEPVYPNPGYGSNSTNGAGSTGASLTGVNMAPAIANTGNISVNPKGNQTSNQTNKTAGNQTAVAAGQQPYGLTYADYNFNATTQQINNMSLVERMWRNAHRGGQMGKAYAGDTSAPLWIDPYERPNDVSMIDEHFYVLQSALNMCVPGTEIMPRYWSLMF